MTTIRAKSTVNNAFLALFIFEEALDSSLSSLSRTLKSKTGIRELERSGVQEYIYVEHCFWYPFRFWQEILPKPERVLKKQNQNCQNLKGYQQKK